MRNRAGTADLENDRERLGFYPDPRAFDANLAVAPIQILSTGLSALRRVHSSPVDAVLLAAAVAVQELAKPARPTRGLGGRESNVPDVPRKVEVSLHQALVPFDRHLLCLLSRDALVGDDADVIELPLPAQPAEGAEDEVG